MNQLVTNGIVLSRINYGEADRIVKLLTPQAGKLSLVARGVRRPKSKLAGGIELFSISSLTYANGRGSLGTLVSARLEQHFGDITKQLDRVQLGYELIKLLDQVTEDEPETAYYELLAAAFAALQDHAVATDIIRLWFWAQLLALAGHTPNLQSDTTGLALIAEQHYTFDLDRFSFAQAAKSRGTYDARHIKFLRLIFAGYQPKVLSQVGGCDELLDRLTPLMQALFTMQLARG